MSRAYEEFDNIDFDKFGYRIGFTKDKETGKWWKTTTLIPLDGSTEETRDEEITHRQYWNALFPSLPYEPE